MNLRQKIAWLLLTMFLASTFASMYYLLDIADQFTLLSLQHSKLHQQASGGDTDPRHNAFDSHLLLNPKTLEKVEQPNANIFAKVLGGQVQNPKLINVDSSKISKLRRDDGATVGSSSNLSHESSFWHHVVDIPAPILIVVLLALYCQVFAVLFYFTLPHVSSMRDVNLCTIPLLGWFYIAQRMRSLLCCNGGSSPPSGRHREALLSNREAGREVSGS